MPLLTPTVWIILIAAALQCATGLGWWVTSTKLENTQAKLVECKAKHQAFVDQVEAAGRRAAEKARQIETEQQRIADETAKSWAAALDFVRADAARRMRALAGQGGAGGSGLSQGATAGLAAPAADADPIPPPVQLAQDCAVTTLTANALQSYIERLQHE